MAGPTQAGTQVKWGTSSNTTYGLIQTMSLGKGGTQKEYRDWQGDTKNLVTYDKHDTISLTAICTSNAVLPEKGELFSIDGKQYRVTEAKVDWSNEDAQKVTLSGRTYPTIGG